MLFPTVISINVPISTASWLVTPFSTYKKTIIAHISHILKSQLWENTVKFSMTEVTSPFFSHLWTWNRIILILPLKLFFQTSSITFSLIKPVAWWSMIWGFGAKWATEALLICRDRNGSLGLPRRPDLSDKISKP